MTQPSSILLSLADHDQRIYFAFNISTDAFVYLNPAFNLFFQMNPIELTPKHLFSMVHRDDRNYLKSAYVMMKAGMFKKNIEFRMTLSDKKEYTLRLSMFLKQEENNERILTGYLEDITVEREYAKKIEELSNKKNAILNILSHDLAGPLGSIQHFTYILNKKIGKIEDPQINMMISSIEKISKRCIQMIQDFIKLEFIESVGVDMVKQRKNLIEILQPFFKEYEESQSQTGKIFNFFSTGQHIYAEVDESKFLQVINNLISNAIKFTEDGGAINLSVNEGSETILIEITDTGIGIPQKFHANLFEKFSNARRTGLKGEPSVGLGMSIIKTIVEWHRGKIWFKSEENMGSTFYIEIAKSK